ncbi:MAG: hypothetical protein AAF934_06905 [Bacteroidota bacterium]
MMKRITLLLLLGVTFISCTTLVSCDKNNELTQEQEAQKLQQMLSEIENMAGSINCEDSANWTYTPLGKKACGGPKGYLAYPTTIDTVKFLSLVEAYKTAEERYNNKWGIISTCDLPPVPFGVTCENGKAVLVYQGL